MAQPALRTSSLQTVIKPEEDKHLLPFHKVVGSWAVVSGSKWTIQTLISDIYCG